MYSILNSSEQYFVNKKPTRQEMGCVRETRRGGAVVKVLALHAQDPIWAPVLIPEAPLPIQLPACGLGKRLRTAQGFGTLHPCGRPGRGS